MDAEGIQTMRRWAGQALAAAAIWALCLTTGCNGFFVYPGSVAGGGTGTGSSTADYVFVANATTGSLAVFAVGTGTLTPVTGSPFALGFIPASVAVNPANTIVYVAGSNSTSSVINAYSIAATGVLSLLTTNVVSTPEVAIAISPDGQWLMALDSIGTLANEAVVDEFQITNSSGQLVAGAGAIFTYPSPAPAIRPMDIKFAPTNGAYVFAAMGTGGDVVFPFTTSNGQFSTPLWLQPVSSSTSEQALAVSPDGTQLYIARSGPSGGLGVYTIGAGGALSQVGSTLAAGQQPISVVVNKAGSDVYIANQIDGTISGYGVASGMVSVLNPATVSTTSAPKALAIDNSGNYLLSASNSGSPDLAMYSYDTTTAGKLDLVAATSTGVDPTGPVAIATTH
jgi:6-phosphogluconolactonase